MTDENAPIRKAHTDAERHLANIQATSEQYQQQIEQHLASARRPAEGSHTWRYRRVDRWATSS